MFQARLALCRAQLRSNLRLQRRGRGRESSTAWYLGRHLWMRRRGHAAGRCAGVVEDLRARQSGPSLDLRRKRPLLGDSRRGVVRPQRGLTPLRCEARLRRSGARPEKSRGVHVMTRKKRYGRRGPGKCERCGKNYRRTRRGGLSAAAIAHVPDTTVGYAPSIFFDRFITPLAWWDSVRDRLFPPHGTVSAEARSFCVAGGPECGSGP